MFLTIKIDKHRIFLIIVISLIIIAVAATGVKFFLSSNDSNNSIDLKLNKKIVEFINSYGWKVENIPVEHEEFSFPNQFNEIYKRYNQYQLSINKDLNPYKGKTVQRITYRVLNYKVLPQYEGQQVYADILVYNDAIIGGNLKTNELNGFMVSLNNKTFKEITGFNEWEYN